MDELWNAFSQTGKVEDYLKYKNKQEITDANENQGLDNKGTTDRRE